MSARGFTRRLVGWWVGVLVTIILVGVAGNVHARFATAGEDEHLLFVNLDSVPPNFDYHPTLAGHEAIAKRFIAASSYFSQKTFLPLVQR